MDEPLIAAAYLPSSTSAAAREFSGPAACREAMRVARLDRIRGYVDTVMDDPDLTAHTAARALGMSVRGLHLALAATGETFGELVQRRRVVACQARLARQDRDATIAAVAFDCGFNSLSSFYRGFRRVYGTCPREAQRTARRLAA